MIKNLENSNIGFDIDEVLSDTVKHFLNIYKHKKWLNLKRNNCTNYRLEKIEWLNIPWEILYNYWQEFIRTDEQLYAKPIKWAIESVSFFKQKWNNIFVITWRHDFEKNITIKWLDKYFPNLITDIIFTNHSLSHRKNKSQYIQDLDIKFFVDDNYDYCLDLAQTWIPIYMPTKPWNKKIKNLPQNIFRINNLKELI